MTPQQEDKLDTVHDAILRMEGKFNLMEEKIKANREFILEHEGLHIAKQKEIDTLKGDKKFILGAIAVLASSTFISAVIFVISLFLK